ncbi:MAG: hypothetical protein ACRDUA_06505 [Micromonosporaceae bacterium]
MGYRRLLMAAGWLIAAVVATGIGIAAVGVIARGLTQPAGDLMSRDEINRELASPGPATSPSGGSSSSPSPDPSATGNRKLFTTPAGTVLARCDGEIAELVSWSPANGYRLREVDPRRGIEAEVSFVRGEDDDDDDDSQRVKVKVTCENGVPRMRLDD